MNWIAKVTLDVGMTGQELAGAFMDKVAAFGNGQGHDSSVGSGQFLYRGFTLFRGEDEIGHRPDNPRL